MYLESEILVSRPVAEVWAFFENPCNLVKWDRSVARVEIVGSVPAGVGFSFDTVGPSADNDGIRSCYRVSEYQPGEYAWVDLTNSKWFSRARWLTALEPTDAGTKIRIGIALTFRRRYLYLWPIIRLSVPAMTRDLGYLKLAIESR
jgi:hypothetical protein